MGRTLAVGTYGEIRSYYRIDDVWHRHHGGKPHRHPDRWKAVAQFCDSDGKVRQLQQSDRTDTGARQRLREYLAERAKQTGSRLTAGARVHEVAQLYLDDVQRRRSGTTYDRYRGRVHKDILPRMGDLLIRECTPGRIHTVLQAIERGGAAPNTLRGIRACISGIMQQAINRDIITVNPTASIPDIEGGTVRAAEAFDLNELLDFLAKVDNDQWAARADLPDLLRFMFGTGCRFGEAIGVRWGDCNLGDQPSTIRNPEGKRDTLPAHSVWINGNIVRVTGQGVLRHTGKTKTSVRIIGLPDFLHTILMQRLPTMAAAGAGVEQPVFPSPMLGWRAPSNVHRSIQRLRDRIGFPDFKTHAARKTVATLLSLAGQNSRQVADALGQSSIQVTERFYIARGLANAGAAKALNAALEASPPDGEDET